MSFGERPPPTLLDKLREILNRHGIIQDASSSWDTKQLIKSAIGEAEELKQQLAQTRALLSALLTVAQPSRECVFCGAMRGSAPHEDDCPIKRTRAFLAQPKG